MASLAFEYEGQVAHVDTEHEDVFFNGKAWHVDELADLRWWSLHNAAVDVLVQYDEGQFYG